MEEEYTTQQTQALMQDDREQLRQQAYHHLHEKQWTLAQHLFAELLEHDGANEDLFRGSLAALDGAEQFEALLAQAQNVLEHTTNAAYALAFKARALQKLNFLSEATIANDQALLLDTNLPLAWINRSGLQLLQQKFPEALRSAQHAVEVAPDDARAWANKGVALLNFDRLLEGLTAFNQSLVCDPTNLFALKMKSEILFKLGRLAEVVTNTEQILRIDPTNSEALSLVMQALRSLERYEELQQTAKELTRLDPENVFAWENYVRSLRGTGAFEAANEALERLLDLDPGNVRFWTMKADTLYRLLRYREAVATADHAIYLNPEYPPARRIREQALKRLYQRKKK
ncbi:MAG: hypothetical protein NVS9B9_05480 [Ktedonobacteraceae bacterium]